MPLGISSQTLTSRDYDFARCGREMWEKPNPLAGYFTTCGNIQDGTLGYRIAGLPLTLQRIVAGQSQDTSPWEMRHQLGYVLLLLHSGFLFTEVLLGGALWWVTRRLLAILAALSRWPFIVFVPRSFTPVLTPTTKSSLPLDCSPRSIQPWEWRCHAGPAKKVALAHRAAHPDPRFYGGFARRRLFLALLLAIGFMAYLAVGRRAYIVPIMMAAIIGTLLLLLASYDFSPDAFSYFFRSGAGRIWFSLQPGRHWLLSLPNSAVTLAAATALLLYLPHADRATLAIPSLCFWPCCSLPSSPPA